MRPDTSLADEILRDLRPAAQLPTLPDKPAAPDMIASPPTAPKLHILEIPLDQICIDPQQRRRYLPADLRAAVIHNTQLLIDQRGGIIRINLEAQKFKLQADRVHLTNIIFNLIDNAIKYSENEKSISLFATAQVAPSAQG